MVINTKLSQRNANYLLIQVKFPFCHHLCILLLCPFKHKQNLYYIVYNYFDINIYDNALVFKVVLMKLYLVLNGLASLCIVTNKINRQYTDR